MIFYHLRAGVDRPAFHRGELYPYLSDDRVEGYIWLSVNGKPMSVWAGDFEKAEGKPEGRDR